MMPVVPTDGLVVLGDRKVIFLFFKRQLGAVSRLFRVRLARLFGLFPAHGHGVVAVLADRNQRIVFGQVRAHLQQYLAVISHVSWFTELAFNERRSPARTLVHAVVIEGLANEWHGPGVFELGQRGHECGVEVRFLRGNGAVSK